MNNIINKLNFIHIYNHINSYWTYFSCAHRISLKIDHILGNKCVPINLKRLNTHRMHSLNRIKFEINNSKIFIRCSKLWKLMNTFQTSLWVKEYMAKEMSKILKWILIKTIACQNLWAATKAICRGEVIRLHAYFRNK